jgi:hypothetical protein
MHGGMRGRGRFRNNLLNVGVPLAAVRALAYPFGRIGSTIRTVEDCFRFHHYLFSIKMSSKKDLTTHYSVHIKQMKSGTKIIPEQNEKRSPDISLRNAY